MQLQARHLGVAIAYSIHQLDMVIYLSTPILFLCSTGQIFLTQLMSWVRIESILTI